jgi:hypothetical protein
MAGDPVIENAAALLMRASQYYLDVLKVDGFRLDAAKHMPSWFWDNLWDASVYNRYKGFDGTTQTPYSFSEAVESNSNMANWVRKPGESGSGYPAIGWQQGNRDALDLNEAGALRDLVENDGSGSWDTIISSSVDNVDGFNNGTIGAMPRVVFDRTVEHLRKMATDVADWDYKPGEEWIAGYGPATSLRAKTAALLNADPAEVALTENVTAAMSYLAAGMTVEPGAEILISDQEHPGGRCTAPASRRPGVAPSLCER